MSNRSRHTRHFQHEHLCHKLGSHLSEECVTYLFLLLATPSVGIQPEELLLTLLVSHGLLAARRGAAHEARHGGALGLDRAIGPTVGLPHWVGRHVYCLTTSLSQSSLHQSSLHTRKPFVLPPPAARCSTRGGALRHGRAPPSAWVRALAGTDSGLVVGHDRHSGPAVGASSGEVQLWQAVLSHLALTAHSQGNRGWALLLLGRGGGQMPWSRRQMSDSSGLPHLPLRYICHLNFLPSRRNSLMPSVKNWTGDN